MDMRSELPRSEITQQVIHRQGLQLLQQLRKLWIQLHQEIPESEWIGFNTMCRGGSFHLRVDPHGAWRVNRVGTSCTCGDPGGAGALGDGSAWVTRGIPEVFSFCLVLRTCRVCGLLDVEARGLRSFFWTRPCKQ